MPGLRPSPVPPPLPRRSAARGGAEGRDASWGSDWQHAISGFRAGERATTATRVAVSQGMWCRLESCFPLDFGQSRTRVDPRACCKGLGRHPPRRLLRVDMERGRTFARIGQEGEDKAGGGHILQRRPVQMAGTGPLSGRKRRIGRGWCVRPNGRNPRLASGTGRTERHGPSCGHGNVREIQRRVGAARDARHDASAARSMTSGTKTLSSPMSKMPWTNRPGLEGSRWASCQGAKRHHWLRSIGVISMGSMR